MHERKTNIFFLSSPCPPNLPRKQQQNKTLLRSWQLRGVVTPFQKFSTKKKGHNFFQVNTQRAKSYIAVCFSLPSPLPTHLLLFPFFLFPFFHLFFPPVKPTAESCVASTEFLSLENKKLAFFFSDPLFNNQEGLWSCYRILGDSLKKRNSLCFVPFFWSEVILSTQQ